MAVKWKWKPAAGGSVPAGLEQKVNQNETNITNLQNNTAKLNQNNTFTGTNTFTGGVVSRASSEFGTEIKAGYGGSEVYFTPEDTSTKALKYGRSGGGRFNIDLENQTQLMGIKDPTADYHAANKQYVDNRMKTRTEAITVNANSTYTINPTSGYQIINVMIGRKRSNDGMYFFEYQTTLNKQVFLDNTTFKIYNQGNVSGFSNNEFKVVITEMKV